MSFVQPAEAPEDDVVNRAIGGIARPFQRQLAWLWNHGFRFLFVIDAVTLFGLMVAINAVRFGTQWPTYPRTHYLIGFGIASAIHLSVNYFAGLYEREPRIGYRSWLPRIATAMEIGIPPTVSNTSRLIAMAAKVAPDRSDSKLSRPNGPGSLVASPAPT